VVVDPASALEYRRLFRRRHPLRDGGRDVVDVRIGG